MLIVSCVYDLSTFERGRMNGTQFLSCSWCVSGS